MVTDNQPARNPDQLTGWKEIAAYLGKSVRTVQRWERQARLPIHRVQPLGEVVYAFRSEIDQWRRSGPGAQAIAAPGDDAREAAEEAPPGEAAARHPGRIRVLVSMLVIAALIGAGVIYRAQTSQIELVATPEQPQVQGQHFQITAKVPDPGITVQRWTRLPNGREESMPPPLAADAQGQVRWGFTTDCHTETGTHDVWVEDLRDGGRSDAVRLVILPNPDCQHPQPDLAGRVEALDQTSVPVGGKLIVRFTIWNMGTADAAATATRVRLGQHSTRTGTADRPVADVPAPPLKVGEASTQSVEISIPPDTAPGVYYVWIVADNGSATIEPDSFNNFARSHAVVVTPK